MNKKMLAVAVLSALLGGMMGAGGLYAASHGKAARVAYGGGAEVGIYMADPTTAKIRIYSPYQFKSCFQGGDLQVNIKLKK